MTINEIADLITNNSFSFKVSIPDNSSYSHKYITAQNASVVGGTVESYLSKIVETNKAKVLHINAGKYNGPHSVLYGKDYNISLDTPKPLADHLQTTLKPLEKPLANHFENHFENPKQTPPPTKNPMENKDYIDYKVLQITHKQLEHYYGESTAKIKKLEDKIDVLHEDNKKLLRDNSTKEDKHELALDRVRLEMDKESKAGLSGLMGELSANPQIIEAVVGFINPKHPMFDKEPQPALEGAPDNNREIKYTDDATVNMMLNDIPRVLSQKDGETMTKIYLLFQEFISKPESLDQAVSTFLPDYKY